MEEKKSNILKLVNKKTGQTFIEPIDMLYEAIDDLTSDDPVLTGKKAILIVLDDSGDNYDPKWMVVNMRRHEIVALLETSKTIMLDNLLYME